MHKHEDYYRILQVHYLADIEIIESAYKKLAKKYHPDINKNEDTHEMMQKINQAYEVLGNPAKRKQYDLEWEDRYSKSHGSEYEHKKAYKKNEESYSAAKSVINEYFGNIMNNHFDFSYELISNIDKLNIARDDFIDWQRAVSTVFQLKEYSCKVYEIHKNKLLNGHMFHDIVEFGVDVVEYNSVMEMMEKEAFTKMTVLEEGKWKIFIGYEKLQPLISKFKALTGLLTAKSIIGELVETHSRFDALTGLLNQRGIIERIENEALRFERYGNVFSMILCDIDIAQMNNTNTQQGINELMIKSAGEVLLNNLRKLDTVGRWGEKTFLIILPETGWSSANKAIQKMRSIFKTRILAYNEKTFKISARFNAVEYASSLEESLDRICCKKK